MKKSLLFLSLAAAMSLSAAAVTPQLNAGSVLFNGSKTIENFERPVLNRAASRANATQMIYSPSNNPYGCVLSELPAGCQVGEAIEFKKATCDVFAGNEITNIIFWNGYNKTTNKNAITKVTLFITETLAGTPVYTQDMVVSTTAYGQNNIALTTPYKIEAGKHFFFGIKFTVTSADDIMVVVDGDVKDDDTGGWIGFNQTPGGNFEWNNFTSQVGSVSIFAVIAGDNLPQNRGKLQGVEPALTTTINNPFDIVFGLVNDGCNDIENVDVEFTVGSAQKVTETITLPQPLAYGKGMYLAVEDAKAVELGNNLPVNFAITKINGVENGIANQNGSGTVLSIPADWSAKRTVVVEEATGMWCGWCPRGIVFMERARQKYNDGTFIPIAVHVANGASAPDNMNCTSYSSWVSDYVSGFPSSFVNRLTTYGMDPDGFDDFEGLYDAIHGSGAVAEVTLKGELTAATAFSKKLTVSGNTRFAFDTDGSDYRMSFVVTEDNVGPYDQTNYYAPAYGQNMTCDGWEKLGAKVSTIYNDVARVLSTYAGVENSVPVEVKANVDNAYEYVMTLPSTVKNLENCHLIGLLVNTKTGVIENATSILGTEITSSVNDAIVSGVEIAAVEGGVAVSGDCGSVNVYTTSGVSVASANGEGFIALPAGLYIVKAGAVAQKVVVK